MSSRDLLYFSEWAWPLGRSSGGLSMDFQLLAEVFRYASDVLPNASGVLPNASGGLQIASGGLPIASEVLPEVYGGAVDTCHCFVCDKFKFV